GTAWKLRAELIAHQGTFEEVDAYGAQRVKEEIGETPKEPGVRIGRAVNGMRTLTVTDTQRRITDFEKTLDATDTTDQPRSTALPITAHAKTPDATDPPDPPASTALLEAFWKRVDGSGGVLRPEYRTVIAIGVDDFAKVSCGIPGAARRRCRRLVSKMLPAVL